MELAFFGFFVLLRGQGVFGTNFTPKFANTLHSFNLFSFIPNTVILLQLKSAQRNNFFFGDGKVSVSNCSAFLFFSGVFVKGVWGVSGHFLKLNSVERAFQYKVSAFYGMKIR